MKSVWPGALASGAVFSALLTFLIFFTAKDNLFVALDDYAYVVNNPNINLFDRGTLANFFTSFYEGNWHPLTMFSLAIDKSIWGVNPFGYHLMNIIIHSGSVFCSCYVFSHLLRTTMAKETRDSSIVIGSVAAALLFGIHPLRVESVVWASERKDVLCLFFMITSIWIYIHFAVEQKSCFRFMTWHCHELYYSLIFAALALMSKPMAVSLPLILCLIDWYPLRRISDRATLYRSLIEKIPFFTMSVIVAVLTMFAQQIAMNHAPVVGILSRVLVACKALLFYLIATVWPNNLTAFYMHPGDVASFALAEYLFYFFMVLFISVVVMWIGRKNHVFAAFWLFYVVTLIPMLGLIQVGGQWVADRYSYLPSLGIALVWGAGIVLLVDRVQKHGSCVAVRCCLILAACQLIFYSVQTVRQISVWRNTETLATRIIDNTPHLSGAPYLARAIYRNETGRYQMALEDAGEAMKIALRRGLTRSYPETAFVQAVILKNLGRFSEALTIMEWGIDACVDPPPLDAVGLRNDLVRLVAGKK